MHLPNAKRVLSALLYSALVAGLLGACSDPVPTLSPLQSDAVIVAFGDSLTHGTGAGRDESYPAILAQLSGRKVINSGVPGEVTAAGAARLSSILERYRPDLLLLCHGGNDLLRRNGEQQTFDNLDTMVTQARAHGVDVVLIGVPQPKLLFLEPAELYDRLAEKRNLVYLRDELPALEGEAGMKSDAIHLNGKGYRRLAEAVYRLLVSSGALP